MTGPGAVTRPRAVLLIVLAAALWVVGCGSPYGPSESERMNRRAELAARPTIDQAVARYDLMQQEIRDRLDTEIGPFTWYQVRDGADSTCGSDFSDLGGTNRFLPPWGFDANLPDTDWPTAARIVTDVTGRYGFNAPGLVIDEPGRHRITGIDTTLGANYEFGTEINTTMQIVTGCHPPAPN